MSRSARPSKALDSLSLKMPPNCKTVRVMRSVVSSSEVLKVWLRAQSNVNGQSPTFLIQPINNERHDLSY